MRAYAVTIGFDKNITEKIQKAIDQIADVTNNDYMISNKIEPHITIGAFYSDNEMPIIELLNNTADDLKADKVLFERIESFYPNVVYLSPRKDAYLSSLNHMINEKMMNLFSAADHEYYIPQNWVPHCALAVQLSVDQCTLAMCEACKMLLPLSASVDKISLAECNPYKRIKAWEI